MSGFFTTRYLIKAANGRWREEQRDFFLPDFASVRREVSRIGGIVQTIHHKKPKWYQREFISRGYKLRFLRALAFHIRAGVSPGKALWLVINGESNTGRRYELEPALEVIRRGGSFATALKELNMFDRATLSILVAGERTGTLKDVVHAAGQQIEEKGKIVTMLRTALGWLWFDVGVSLSSLFGIQFGLLPWLKDSGIQTTNQAKIAQFNDALTIAQWVNGGLLFIGMLMTGVLVMFTLVQVMSRPSDKTGTSPILTSLPLIKSFYEDTAVAESFSVAGRMMQGHVAFDEAARTALESTPVDTVRGLWRDALFRVSRGDPVERAMRTDVLTRGELLEIAAHQDSQQLGQVLLNISEHRAEEAKMGLKRLIQAGLIATIFFSVGSALVAMWVVWIQNEGINATTENMSEM